MLGGSHSQSDSQSRNQSPSNPTHEGTFTNAAMKEEKDLDDGDDKSVYRTVEERVFSTLHPIITQLVTSVKEFQTTKNDRSNTSHITGGTSSVSSMENMLKSLMHQSELITKMRNEARMIYAQLNMCGSKSKDQEEEDNNATLHLRYRCEEDGMKFRSALYQMQQLIFMPLLLVLQRLPFHDHPRDEKNQDNAQSIRMYRVLENAHSKCVEYAALSLAFFIDIIICGRSNEDKDYHDDEDQREKGNDYHTLTVPVEIRMQIFCALHMAMGQLLVPNKLTSEGMLDGDKLDKGEHCMHALLSCMESILPYKQRDDSKLFNGKDVTADFRENVNDDDATNKSAEEERKFGAQLLNTMNGHLLPAVVMHCLSVLEDSAQSKSTSSNPNTSSISEPMIVHAEDIKGNVPLKLQAMRVVENLLYLGYSYRPIVGKKEEEDWTLSLTEMWRSIFPGIFMTICRELLSHLRFSTSHSSPKLAVQAMKVLSLLMNRTLTLHVQTGHLEDTSVINECGNGINGTRSSGILSDAAKKLLAVATAPTSISTSSVSRHSNLPPKISQFLLHVRAKIPSLLQMIFQLAPTHKSISVRRICVTHLVTSILTVTYTSWDLDLSSDLKGDDAVKKEEEEVLNKLVADLRIAAVECIMCLMKSEQGSIVMVCRKTLCNHRLTVGEDIWNEMIRKGIIPRIIELMKRMPALARSGRESNLSATMTLIAGYVSVLHSSMTEEEKSDPLDHSTMKKSHQSIKRKKGIYSTYLSNKLTSDEVRQCLIDIFVMDNKTVQQGNILQFTCESDPEGDDHPYLISKFRYMREETARVGCDMIRNIAILIGFRRAMTLMDACIADIFESLSMRMGEGRSVVDGAHARWLEQNFGLVIVANETLRAFKGKQSSRRIKIVQSLTSSMISLICSDVLWQLPSLHAWADAMGPSLFSQIDAPVKHQTMFMISNTQHLIPTSKMGIEAKGSLQEQHQNCQALTTSSQASTEALVGNGMLTIGFMNVLVTLSTILCDEFKVYIPSVIYPLMQKTSDLHSDTIRNNAYASLTRIASASSYSSSEEMLAANSSYLMETLVAELRGGGGSTLTLADLQSQAVCFYSLHNVMTFMLNNISEIIDIEDPSSWAENKILLIVDMQASMTDWFTKQFQKSSRSLLQCIMVPMGLVRFFQGSVNYLNEVLSMTLKKSPDSGADGWDDINSECFRWEDLLLEFKLDNTTGPDSNDEFEEKISATCTSVEDRDEDEIQSTLSGHVLQRLVVNLKEVMTINSTILALPDLKLQRLSCDLFTGAFELFSMVQNHIRRCNKDDPIVTALGNPLAQNVSEYWPTIRIRLQVATSSFIRAYRDDQIGTKRHLASLLSSIFDVISSMGKLSGEMVTNRFQDDIYPCMGKLFSHLLMEGHSTHASITFSSTDEIVLKSLLDTLNAIFSSKEGKMFMASIVPSAGSMILPLLAQQTALGESAMNVMKLLLSIDCDCMWRSLLTLSGREFPPCPLRFGSGKPTHHEIERTTSQADTPEPILRERANALMEFADSLPEQPLLHI